MVNPKRFAGEIQRTEIEVVLDQAADLVLLLVVLNLLLPLVMNSPGVNTKAKLGIAKATGRAYVAGNLAVEVKQMTFALAK